MVVDYKILSSLEKVFIDEKPAAPETKSFSALKGEKVSFQIAFCQTELSQAHISFKFNSEIENLINTFEVLNVPVTLPCYHIHDDNLLRTAPGVYPDIVSPLDGKEIQLVYGQWKSLWVTLTLPCDLRPDNYKIEFEAYFNNEVCIKDCIGLKVIDAVLPEQKIKFTQWFHSDCLATYYQCPVFSEKHWEIIENFMKNALEFGINMILVPILTPPLDTAVGTERPTIQLVDVFLDNGRYTFKFDKLERYISLALKCGFKYFEISHLFTQWGALHAPKVMAVSNGKEKKIFGWETNHNDAEYVDFLREMLANLKEWFKKRGIFERCYFHISDEPNIESYKAYAENFENLKDVLSDCNSIDALSNYEFYKNGLVKHPIPSIDAVEPFIENNVPDLWTYYCCGQYNKVSNHFINMPGVRTRIIAAPLYKYRISGFLHWGFNFYYSQFSLKRIDPFAENSGVGAFPGGDPFIVYPGAEGKPISSQRQYLLCEAMQDLRAMQLLESLTCYDYVTSIIESFGEITFKQYPHESEALLKIREKINDLIEEKTNK